MQTTCRPTAAPPPRLHPRPPTLLTPPHAQLILGGHDHHWESHRAAPHGTLVLKSGTDFRCVWVGWGRGRASVGLLASHFSGPDRVAQVVSVSTAPDAASLHSHSAC